AAATHCRRPLAYSLAVSPGHLAAPARSRRDSLHPALAPPWGPGYYTRQRRKPPAHHPRPRVPTQLSSQLGAEARLGRCDIPHGIKNALLRRTRRAFGASAAARRCREDALGHQRELRVGAFLVHAAALSLYGL